MTWYKSLSTIAKDPKWSNYQDPIQGRYLLGRIYTALQSSSEHFRVAWFEEKSEEFLDKLAEHMSLLLTQRGGDALCAGPPGAEALFSRAVGLMRYLDEYHRPDQLLFLVDEQMMRDLSFQDFYVSPCRRMLVGRGPARGQSFRRRGLRFHRVIPREVQGYRTELVRHPDLSRNGVLKRKVSAGVFSGFELHCKDASEDKFLADRVSCAGAHDTVLIEQLEQARTSSSHTIIWPELTIPETSLDKVVQSLSRNSLNRHLPGIVVAGSWHVSDEGKHYNRSSILSGRGKLLFHQDKALPYFSRQAGSPVEGVEPAAKIKLLITDSEMIGVFICLDFCHNERSKLIDCLNLSLALVPSMGGISTLEAHVRTAESLKIGNGTRSIIVQQSLPEISENSRLSGYLAVIPKVTVTGQQDDGGLMGGIVSFMILNGNDMDAKSL